MHSADRVNLPDKKRKFIELYLYAQGIIYSRLYQFSKIDDATSGYFGRPANIGGSLTCRVKLICCTNWVLLIF